MSSMDPLRRVQQLIELAQIKPGDDDRTINNARNAAWAACQLIRIEKLAIVKPEDLATFVVSAESPGSTRPTTRKRGEGRARVNGKKVKEILADAAGDAASAIFTDFFKS